MNFLLNKAEKVLNTLTPAPKISPPVRNRIDADPSLINYHETGNSPMPYPRSTDFLPCRTRLAVNPFTDLAKAQSEAYYEEILTIPAASLNIASAFSAGHWYVVHPVTYYQVRDFSNRVLKDLEEWLEAQCPNELFTRKAKQMFAFKDARNESLDQIKKELARREKRRDIGEEEGYTGEWEMLTGEVENEEDKKQDDGVKAKDAGENGVVIEPVLCHTKAALEEAAEGGRKAAEEARVLVEWQMEH